MARISKKNRKKQRRQRQRKRLCVESLESRQLMAVSPVNLIGGTLMIDGSLDADHAVVREIGSDIRAELNGETWDFSSSRVDRIVFDGGDGNDYFRNDTDIRCTVNGGNGADLIYGGDGNDVLMGGSGDDRIYGRGGNDNIWGSSGNDRLYGGSGTDWVYGDEGNDLVYGGSGDDTLRGGTGNDRLYGQDGQDRLYGQDGHDYLFGHNGNDRLYGEDGHDRLYGGAGDDALYGQSGNDRLYGGIGDDRLSGGSGNDQLYGQGDDDRLYGHSGDDTLNGGQGNDFLDGHGGRDTLWGESGDDRLEGGTGDDVLYGGDGDDTLYGEAGNDRLFGSRGADTLRGGADDDYLHGSYDNDSLYGDAGDDELLGNSGADRLYGGSDNDTLRGGSGNDHVAGNDGNDHLYGGSGEDSFYGGSGDDTIVSIDDSTADVIFGQGGFDSFWIDFDGFFTPDPVDAVRDASAAERATNLHMVRRFANGADRTLDGDDIADPTDGLHYKDFADRPLFANAGPSANDIDQNALGDCWLLASMGAVADADPNTIRQTVVSLGDGTYAVRLGGNNFYRVDAELPTISAASWTLTYAGLGIDNSLWGAVVEKAYTHHRSGADTYASVASGPSTEGLRGMHATGVGWNSFSSYSSGQAVVNDIGDRYDRGQAVVVGITTPATGSALVGNHAYTVVGVTRDRFGDVASITLRNPWGPAGLGRVLIVNCVDFSGVVDGDIAWGNVG